jgi:glycosyltransferase involved in cell wall biosynthesis
MYLVGFQRMKVAVVISVYNEESHVAVLLHALQKQTRQADEIVIVDDGSKDKTLGLLQELARHMPRVRILAQSNAGPAAGRNKAWQACTADVCVFTDGDCVPEPDWLDRLVRPLETDQTVGAAGGTYKTLNTARVLARFIGLEIAWRYRKAPAFVDVHGTYNLAIRKKILEEMGGFNEQFPKPSGEDWDLTYRISRRYKIAFTPAAVVGHYHPESFWAYMENQVRRSYDRVRLYRDHPALRSGDSYTGRLAKYQVAAIPLLLLSLVTVVPAFSYGYFVSLAILTFLVVSSLSPFAYYLRRDPAVAFASVPVQLARQLAWIIGIVKAMVR